MDRVELGSRDRVSNDAKIARCLVDVHRFVGPGDHVARWVKTNDVVLDGNVARPGNSNAGKADVVDDVAVPGRTNHDVR